MSNAQRAQAPVRSNRRRQPPPARCYDRYAGGSSVRARPSPRDHCRRWRRCRHRVATDARRPDPHRLPTPARRECRRRLLARHNHDAHRRNERACDDADGGHVWKTADDGRRDVRNGLRLCARRHRTELHASAKKNCPLIALVRGSRSPMPPSPSAALPDFRSQGFSSTSSDGGRSSSHLPPLEQSLPHFSAACCENLEFVHRDHSICWAPSFCPSRSVRFCCS
jgi:hypothetical protein